MGKGKIQSSALFQVSGDGAEIQEVQVLPPSGGNLIGAKGTPKFTGRIRHIKLRQNAAGLATVADFFLVHNNQTGVVAATLDRLNAPFGSLAVTPLTASATVPFLDTPITAEPIFVDSLLFVANVTTATGAWTFHGRVEIEM